MIACNLFTIHAWLSKLSNYVYSRCNIVALKTYKMEMVSADSLPVVGQGHVY